MDGFLKNIKTFEVLFQLVFPQKEKIKIKKRKNRAFG